ALERLRPHVRAARCLDQLSGDADAVAFLAYAALEDVCDVELLADAAQVVALSLEGKRRGTANDAQAVDVRQRVEDLLGYAVGEVFLIPGRAEIREGQDGDRRGGGGRRSGARAHHEVPERARRGGEGTDAHQHQREARAGEPARGSGALDAPGVDV